MSGIVAHGPKVNRARRGGIFIGMRMEEMPAMNAVNKWLENIRDNLHLPRHIRWHQAVQIILDLRIDPFPIFVLPLRAVSIRRMPSDRRSGGSRASQRAGTRTRIR